jgi:hypothetical protein
VPGNSRLRFRACEDTQQRRRHSNASELSKNDRIERRGPSGQGRIFLNPKTQSPDFVRRSGLWRVSLPWEGGLCHVFP